MHQLGVPPPNGWTVGGFQQDNHSLSPLFGGRQAPIVAPLAAMGRILLQFVISDGAVGDAV
jgi:hypothetical protein